MTARINFAPGARVEIRDAEWIIRRVDASSDGGKQLTCDGISELVRGKSAIFLTQLEDHIKILDPATTELVQDQSNAFEQSLLYIESQLRQATASDQKIHVAHRAAMDVVPYQLDPTIQALKQPRQRILIADAVGLGKTLEAGILVTELMQRGRGQRILVLTLKSMMTQFQKEFWNRFTIPLTRLDSNGLQRVRSRIPGNHNPFYYYDKSIISIDTLKQDNEFKHYLDQAYWDIIVIDECHNVADRGTSSQRAELAQLLATRSDTLIMLSATPHDGRARSFASLMNMLDPTAISDPENYGKEDFQSKGLVVRRFKKDIRDQVQTEFKERTVHSLKHPASLEEEAAYEALLAVPFTYKGKFDPEKQGHLIRIGLQKALFSSPSACVVSVNERINKLRNAEEPCIGNFRCWGLMIAALWSLVPPTWCWKQTAAYGSLTISQTRLRIRKRHLMAIGHSWNATQSCCKAWGILCLGSVSTGFGEGRWCCRRGTGNSVSRVLHDRLVNSKDEIARFQLKSALVRTRRLNRCKYERFTLFCQKLTDFPTLCQISQWTQRFLLSKRSRST